MKWLKDPLIAFLLCGAAIYALAQWQDEDEISYRIEVSQADLQRLSDQWAMQMRRPPTASELQGLLQQFVKEEIYYREAQRMGLQANDTIIRRRLVQKLTFLTEDIATAQPADQAELQAYFAAHAEDYRVPVRYSFRHRYFSVDRRPQAEQQARQALADPAITGDPFMLQKEYVLRSEREIGDLFGREFAKALTTLAPDTAWQGPLQSAYGWHPVLVLNKTDSHIPPFAEIAERVAADAQAAQRAQANEAYYAELQNKYAITYPEPSAAQ